MLVDAAKYIGAGVAVVSLGGVGTGIGTIFSSYVKAVGRSPRMEAPLFRRVLLGFALTEAIALFGLMMSFLILFS